MSIYYHATNISDWPSRKQSPAGYFDVGTDMISGWSPYQDSAEEIGAEILVLIEAHPEPLAKWF